MNHAAEPFLLPKHPVPGKTAWPGKSLEILRPHKTLWSLLNLALRITAQDSGRDPTGRHHRETLVSIVHNAVVYYSHMLMRHTKGPETAIQDY